MSKVRTIVSSGEGLRYEWKSAGVISPGDLLDLASTDLVSRHGTAGGVGFKVFAIENEVFGKGVEVDYAINDNVLTEACTSGMAVNASIAISAAAIVIGDKLESAGDGSLRKLTTGAVIGMAMEAVDNSAGITKTWCRTILL